jgi:nucleoid-associated protein YgaU
MENAPQIIPDSISNDTSTEGHHAHPREKRSQRGLAFLGLGTAGCALLLGSAALFVGSNEAEPTLAAEPTINTAYLSYNEPHPALEQMLKEKGEQAALILLLQKQLDDGAVAFREMEERLKFSESKSVATETPSQPAPDQQALQKELALAKTQIDELQRLSATLKEQLAVKPHGTVIVQSYQGATPGGQNANQRIKEQDLLIRELSASLQQQKNLIAKLENSRNELIAKLDNSRNGTVAQLNTRNEPIAKLEIPRNAPKGNPEAAPKGAEAPVAIAAPKTTRSTLQFVADAQFNKEEGQQTHTVGKGETLSGISTKYYGTSKRWAKIYEANKSSIADANNLKVGTSLVIPE